MIKKCKFCKIELNSKTVYLYSKRKDIIDKCDSCCDKLEQGYDLVEMYKDE